MGMGIVGVEQGEMKLGICLFGVARYRRAEDCACQERGKEQFAARHGVLLDGVNGGWFERCSMASLLSSEDCDPASTYTIFRPLKRLSGRGLLMRTEAAAYAHDRTEIFHDPRKKPLRLTQLNGLQGEI